eukprot:2914019-Amphidinium_carterae.1
MSGVAPSHAQQLLPLRAASFREPVASRQQSRTLTQTCACNVRSAFSASRIASDLVPSALKSFHKPDTFFQMRKALLIPTRAIVFGWSRSISCRRSTSKKEGWEFTSADWRTRTRTTRLQVVLRRQRRP